MSVVKIPSYVVGTAAPIRSVEPIDSVTYWNADLPQIQIVDFFNKYNDSNRITFHTHVKNYKAILLEKSLKNTEGQSSDQITIIHDKFYFNDYTERNLLPSLTNYKENNKIYSNGDYLAFDN